MNKQLSILILLYLTISCTKTEKNENDWIILFDGTSTDGWRNFNGDSLAPQWVIKNGELTYDTELRLESEKEGGNDIIYAKEEFSNFELYLEWKLPKGGNSGIFYHVKEGYSSPYDTSPEYQLIDDSGWEEINKAKLQEWQKAGANYAMHNSDTTQKKLNPAGEWNTSRIRFTAELVEHWLNGKKIVSFVPWSDDWHKRRNLSKWKDYPDYGKFKTGYIGLQDHDSPLWFRNIKIKKL